MKSSVRTWKAFVILALHILITSSICADGFTNLSLGRVLERGLKYRITWTASAGSGQKLLFIRDGYPVNQITTVSTPDGGQGSYDYVANEIGDNLQLQLMSNDNRVLITSQMFKIVSRVDRSITFISPSPGGKFNVGDKVRFTWTYTGNTGSLDANEQSLECCGITCSGDTSQSMGLSIGGNIGQNGQGSVEITIPSFGRSSMQDCRMSMNWMNRGTEQRPGPGPRRTLYDASASSALFSIVDTARREREGFIDITSPAKGTKFKMNDGISIQWNYASWMTTPVDIFLFGKKIASNVSLGQGGKGSYNWKIDSIPKGDNMYYLEVRTINNSHHTSSSPFYLSCNTTDMRFDSFSGEDLILETESPRQISFSGPKSLQSSNLSAALIRAAENDLGLHLEMEESTFSSNNPGYFILNLQGLRSYYSFEEGYYKLKIFDKNNGCPALVSNPITITKKSSITILHPAAGDSVEMSRPGMNVFLGNLTWNASVHYKDQNARITLNRDSGEVAVLAEAVKITNGDTTYKYLMPRNLSPGSDYYIKMVVTGGKGQTIEGVSGKFTMKQGELKPILDPKPDLFKKPQFIK